MMRISIGKAREKAPSESNTTKSAPSMTLNIKVSSTPQQSPKTDGTENLGQLETIEASIPADEKKEKQNKS